jgi:hypothetical protein
MFIFNFLYFYFILNRTSEYPSLVTLKVQTQAVKENGYEDPWIISSAIAYYNNNPQIMSIPHYVKYNR